MNYISDNLIIKNNKSFYCDLEDKLIKINTTNWHKYFYDYGYIKLDYGWKKRLKEYNKKNSCFGLLECGSDGDCLFHVLAEAFNNNLIINNQIPKYDVQYFRNLISEEINDNNFDTILTSYKLEKENDEFNGLWDPFKINTKEELKKEIQTCGDNFWGDHILIQLLQDKLNLNVILLNTNIIDYNNTNNNIYRIQPIAARDISHYDNHIIINYEDSVHFQLIGYFDGNLMKTLFTKAELPQILLDVYFEDTYTILE